MSYFQPLGRYLLILVVGTTAAWADSPSPDYWFARGNFLYSEGKYVEAISAYHRDVDLKGQHDYSWLNIAKCLRHTEKFSAAGKIITYLRGRKTHELLTPELPLLVESEAKRLAKAAWEKGISTYKKQEYEKSLGYFDFLASFDHTDQYRFYLAMSYYYLGKCDSAKPIFQSLSKEATEAKILSESTKMLPLSCTPTNRISPIIGLLELSGGYNNNIFAGSPGFPALAAPVGEAQISFQIPYAQAENHNFWIEILLEDDEVIGYPEYRSLLGSVAPRLRWHSSSNAVDVGP
jgi:tetratricopeptide (TPR) repeat protein